MTTTESPPVARCRNGHPATPENTHIRSKGSGRISRECKLCLQLREAARRDAERVNRRVRELSLTPTIRIPDPLCRERCSDGWPCGRTVGDCAVRGHR